MLIKAIRSILLFLLLMLGSVSSVEAGAFTVHSHNDTETVTCDDAQATCSWEDTVMFINKTGETLHGVVAHNSSYSLLKFQVNGTWQTGMHDIQDSVLPAYPVELPIKLEVPLETLKRQGELYQTVYVDGRVCKEKIPSDCVAYGATKFGIRMKYQAPPQPTPTTSPQATNQPSTETVDKTTLNTPTPTPTATVATSNNTDPGASTTSLTPTNDDTTTKKSTKAVTQGTVEHSNVFNYDQTDVDTTQPASEFSNPTLQDDQTAQAVNVVDSADASKSAGLSSQSAQTTTVQIDNRQQHADPINNFLEILKLNISYLPILIANLV